MGLMWWKASAGVLLFVAQEGCSNPLVFTPDSPAMARGAWWTVKAKQDALATWRETEAELWLGTHGFVKILRGASGETAVFGPRMVRRMEAHCPASAIRPEQAVALPLNRPSNCRACSVQWRAATRRNRE